MFVRKPQDASFFGVAMFFILAGAIIFTCGLVAWYISAVSATELVSGPFTKVIGGSIVMALGYVVLELELARKK